MEIPSKTKKGHITSRTTTYVHGDESYVIDVSDTSVSCTISHKGVKKREFSWKIDFAIEMALIILKGMNRELLIKTLISLQDFHPGSFVGPDGVTYDTIESDYADAELRAIASLSSEPGIPLEDITPAEMGSEYDEGFRIAQSTPFFRSYSDWSLSSGINASDEFQLGFEHGMCVPRLATNHPAGKEPSPMRPSHPFYPVVRSFANMLLAFPASHFSKAVCGLEMIDWEEHMELPIRKLLQDAARLKTGENPPIEQLEEGQARIRAVLDVIYDLADVPVTELQENLEKGIAHLFSIGALTLDSLAEVVSWDSRTVVNPKSPLPNTTTVTERIFGVDWGGDGGGVGAVTRIEVESFETDTRGWTSPQGAGQTPEEANKLVKSQEVINWIKRSDITGMGRILHALEEFRHTTPELIEFRTLWRGACEEKKPSAE